MKLYIFVFSFMSTIQKGIQAAHVVTELLTKYDSDEVWDWAEEDKTIVLLEGGNYSDIRLIREFADKSEFASAEFVEDYATFNGMTTAVAVLAPADIKLADYLETDAYTREIIKQIKNRRLAS